MTKDIEARKAINKLTLQLTSVFDTQLLLLQLIMPVLPDLSSEQKEKIRKMIDQTKASINLSRKSLWGQT